MKNNKLIVIICFCFIMLCVMTVLKNNNRDETDIILGDTNTKGDVNNDGKVNSTDYIAVRKHILKQTTLKGDMLKKADVTGDSKITSLDYIAIRKMILNNKATPSNNSGLVYKDSKAMVIDGKYSYSVVNINVTDYGADPTGAKDSTNAFISAIKEAESCTIISNQKKCGGVIYVPKGKYVLTKTISLPSYVGLIGELEEGTAKGTILVIKHGKNDTNVNNAAINMHTQSSIQNIAFWYPEQSVDGSGNVVKFPPTINFDHGVNGMTLNNITFVNSYTAMDLATKQFNNSIYFITNIYGTPLHIGILNDTNLDTIKADNINFSPKYWLNSGLSNVPSKSNLEKALMNSSTAPAALVMERVDWFFFANIKIDGYYIGLKLQDTSRNQSGYGGGAEGEIYDSSITNCYYPIYVKHSQHMTITNTTLSAVNATGAKALYVMDKNTHNYSIINSTISSPSDYAVYYQGQKSISINNSKVTGRIAKTNSQAKISLVGNTLSNTSVDGCNIGSATFYTKSKPDYSKRVVTKPKSKNLIKISANNSEDITNKIKDAINKLKSTGGIVYIPNGEYIVSSHIDVPSGIEIRGTTSWAHEHEQISNIKSNSSIIKTYYKGDVLFTLNSNSGINGLSIIYPENWQKSKDPTEYPYTIRGNGSNIYIMNLYLPGSWNGIDLATNRCDNHYLEHIWGEFFNLGINVGGGSKNGIIRNSHFTINTISNYVSDNAQRMALTKQTVIRVGSSSNENIFHIFAFGPGVGFNFDGADNFSAVGVGVDFSSVAIKVSGKVNGQIINPLLVVKPQTKFNGIDLRINLSSNHYIETMDNFSGTLDIINSLNWGGVYSPAFDFKGNGDIHVYGGIIENSAEPEVRVSNTLMSMFGVLINEQSSSGSSKIRLDNGVKTVSLYGNVCKNGSSCANGLTNNAKADVGSLDPITNCQQSNVVNSANWESLTLKNTSINSTSATTTICGFDKNYNTLEYYSNSDGTKTTSISNSCATITIKAGANQALSYRMKNSSSSSQLSKIGNIGKYLIFAQVYNKFLYVGSPVSNNSSNLGHWVNKSSSVSSSVKEIGNVALEQNKNKSNNDIVQAVYRGILGREADNGGLNNWVNELNSGKSRNVMLNQFVDSPEAQAIYKAWGYN